MFWAIYNRDKVLLKRCLAGISDFCKLKNLNYVREKSAALLPHFRAFLEITKRK